MRKVVPVPLFTEEDMSAAYEETINDLVSYVNVILTSKEAMALLSMGRNVHIFDTSAKSPWQSFCRQAVERFKDEGWVIKPSPYENGYYFSLPNKDVK